MKQVLAGIKPTGRLHLGHYFSVIKPAQELQANGDDIKVFVADLHARNALNDGQIREYSDHIMDTLEEFGLEATLQSDNALVETMYTYFMNYTTLSMLQRMHAFKALGLAEQKRVNMGLLTYPVLMAADIFAYNKRYILVGEDQLQHIEFANAVFKRAGFGKKQVEPLVKSVTLLGNDGRKMSKSYNNTLFLDSTPTEITDFVNAIETDSKGLNERKEMDEHLLVYYYKLVCPEQAQDYLNRLNNGGFGYKDAKVELMNKLHDYLRNIRKEK